MISKPEGMNPNDVVGAPITSPVNSSALPPTPVQPAATNDTAGLTSENSIETLFGGVLGAPMNGGDGGFNILPNPVIPMPVAGGNGNAGDGGFNILPNPGIDDGGDGFNIIPNPILPIDLPGNNPPGMPNNGGGGIGGGGNGFPQHGGGPAIPIGFPIPISGGGGGGTKPISLPVALPPRPGSNPGGGGNSGPSNPGPASGGGPGSVTGPGSVSGPGSTPGPTGPAALPVSPPVSASSSDQDFLTALYHGMFGRDPDADGLQYWEGQLANGTSREDVVKGFMESPEYQKSPNKKYVDHIVNDYKTLLGRDPDAEGLVNWANAVNDLKNQNPNITDDQIFALLDQGFKQSAEYTQNH